MRKPRWTPGSWVLLCLIVFSSCLLWQSFSLSRVAAHIPQLIILGTLLLLGTRLVLDLGLFGKISFINKERDETLPASDNQPNHQGQRAKRFLLSILWISMLACCTWLLGLVIGPALFCLAFLRGSAGESWLMSLGYSAVMALLVGLVFSVLLKLTPYQGVLLGMLN